MTGSRFILLFTRTGIVQVDMYVRAVSQHYCTVCVAAVQYAVEQWRWKGGKLKIKKSSHL